MTMYEIPKMATHPLDKFRDVNVETLGTTTLKASSGSGIYLINPLLAYGSTNPMLSSPNSNSVYFARSASNLGGGNKDIIWRRYGSTNAFSILNYTDSPAADIFAIDYSGSITTVNGIKGVWGEINLFSSPTQQTLTLATTYGAFLPEHTTKIDFINFDVGSFRLLVYGSGSAASSKSVIVQTIDALLVARCAWNGTAGGLFSGSWTNFNESNVVTMDSPISIYASGAASESLYIHNIRLQYTNKKVA
jgi:hypothetical protein